MSGKLRMWVEHYSSHIAAAGSMVGAVNQFIPVSWVWVRVTLLVVWMSMIGFGVARGFRHRRVCCDRCVAVWRYGEVKAEHATRTLAYAHLLVDRYLYMLGVVGVLLVASFWVRFMFSWSIGNVIVAICLSLIAFGFIAAERHLQLHWWCPYCDESEQQR